MDTSQPHHCSHLFTVRLWAEDFGDGRTEWRGQVQHVLSGDVRYFRDWPTLIALLLAMLLDSEKNLVMHWGWEDRSGDREKPPDPIGAPPS